MAHEVIARRSDRNADELVDWIHYSPAQIARIVGLSKSTISRLMDQGKFPRSHGVTPRRGVWGRQVRAYLEQQAALAPEQRTPDAQVRHVGGDPSHPTDQTRNDVQTGAVGGVADSSAPIVCASERDSDADQRG